MSFLKKLKLFFKTGDTRGEPLAIIKGKTTGVSLRVFLLRKEHEPQFKEVEIELVAKSLLSYQMMPIKLSIAEARLLSQTLEDALRKP